MRTRLLASAAAAAIAFPALAQTELPGLRLLPETVVTATRVATPIERIPAGVTVIGRQAIEERGYRSLVDALSAVPGLRPVQLGPFGQQTSVFIRGTNSSHVLVLRDGMPINDPSAPGALFDFGSDLLDDVERIEVVRGPMSGLYGSGAIGGVVNIITRSGLGIGRPARAVSEVVGGTQSTAGGSAVVAGEGRAFDYALVASGFTTQGFNVQPPRLATNIGERDGARIGLLTANLGATFGERFRAFAFGRLREHKADIDQAGQDDPNYTVRNRSGMWRAGVTGSLIPGSLDTTLAVGQSRDNRQFRDRPDLFPFSGSDDSRYIGTRTVYQWDNTLRLPDGGAFNDAAITFGLQRIEDHADVKVRFDGPFGPFAQDVDRGTRNHAGYVGAQTRLFGRLDLTANLRHEMPRDFADTTTWRLGGVLAIPEAALSLHAAYGTSFRAPTLFDLFGVGSFGFRGNPNLRPEKGRGGEVGVAFDFAAVMPRPGRLSVSYFRYRIRDLIADDAFFTTRINIGRADIEGVETALDLAPADWLDLRATYTWTVAQDQDSGEQLLRRPRHQGSVGATLRANPRFGLSTDVLLFGPAADVLYRDSGAFAGRGINQGGLVVNVSARWQVTDVIEWFALARNVTGSRYEPANAFVVPGAWALTGLRARW
ncbi:MAG: TonB-dependent receptor [Elioraea sp.]|nr:TonB-dependent receptor [Elioraea sp.]